MSEVRVDVNNINEAYALLDKLSKAGYSKPNDYTWEYKSHIREFSFDKVEQEPRHVLFSFNDPQVAFWFRLSVL